jgi:1-acyl-sn-glycerol-3-phosphate acyltransferase
VTSLILASSALLLFPWLLGPVFRLTEGRPEIRGFLDVLWWLNRGYCHAFHRLVAFNMAPLPEHGPAILVANHTSGIDNFVLQAGCRRVLGFMIAREIAQVWFVWPIVRALRCIPVRRDGRDLSATRDALRALKDGRVLPIFPEGKITAKSGREFGPGKPGAAYLTLRAGVPVIPAYIRGTPETATVWEALVTPSKVRVLFGPPIDLSDLNCDPVDRDQEKAQIAAVTERLMDAIRDLRQQSLALEATI